MTMIGSARIHRYSHERLRNRRRHRRHHDCLDGSQSTSLAPLVLLVLIYVARPINGFVRSTSISSSSSSSVAASSLIRQITLQQGSHLSGRRTRSTSLCSTIGKDGRAIDEYLTVSTTNATGYDVDTISPSLDSSLSSSSFLPETRTTNIFPTPTTESTLEMDLGSSATDANDERTEYQKGLVIVGFITLLFSSNSPALHAAFSAGGSDSNTPPVLLLNGAVSLVALVGLTLGGDTLESNTDVPSSVREYQQQQRTTTNNNDGTKGEEDALAWVAGCELGLWKTLGTIANIWGLALTTASHGALLIQLTTLIVPVVQGVQGVPIPRKIQFSILLALAGVVCFTQDTTATMAATAAAATATDNLDSATGLATTIIDADMVATATAAVTTTTSTSQTTGSIMDILGTTTTLSLSTTAAGDILCVIAAIFYSVYDLRLFVRGKQVPTKALITRKIATQACLSMILLIVLSGSESISYIQSTLHSLSNDGASSGSNNGILSPATSTTLLVPAVVLWSGIAVNAIAPYLQVGGQQIVGPTRCQTIYASQPLWAAILSYVFLGETIGTQGLIGGSVFLVALFLAATAEVPDPDCDSTNCEV